MATLEKIVLRDGQADDRTWRQRVSDAVGGAVRSYWRGPFGSGDKELAKLFGEPAVSSAVSVNESTAFGVSAFASACFLISWDIASLPLFHFKNLPGGGKERTNSRLNTLLHDQANPDTTAFEFRAALMVNALAGGNGYAEIERDASGRPVALWNVEPSRVSMFLSGGRRQYRIAQPSGGEVILPANDVLHIKGPSYDAVTGFDTVKLAREALGLSIAAEQFGGTFFGNGSQLGGVLTSTSQLPPMVRKNLTEALEARHRGSGNAHRWLLLESGVQFSEVGSRPRDSQYVELRTFQLREIARFFRIPVSLLGDLERSTFANEEQELIKSYKSCLRPWLVSLEQQFSMKLIPSLERNQQSIEHVVEGFLRADTQQRGAFYASMLDRGVLTINEVRALENLPPIAGGDVPRVPMNAEPLGGEQ